MNLIPKEACSIFSGSVFRKTVFRPGGVSVLNTENL